jgi:hypothetical protein
MASSLLPSRDFKSPAVPSWMSLSAIAGSPNDPDVAHDHDGPFHPIRACLCQPGYSGGRCEGNNFSNFRNK